MLYMVHVYNHVARFWDKYMVQAEDKQGAIDEARKRLDEETDDGSTAYSIDEIIQVKD